MSKLIKTSKEIELMRESGRIAALILAEIKKIVKPGITTTELNKIAEDLIKKYDVKPAFKDYDGFPASLCTSINDTVVHGVPNDVPLKEGDVLGLDFGVIYDGWYSDLAETLLIGSSRVFESEEASDKVFYEARRLIRVTKKALKLGIKKARPGNTTGDIGNTIERYIKNEGYEVVKDLAGHGIGRKLHEEPQIPNFGSRRSGYKLEPGMVIAIEPMVIAAPVSSVGGFGKQASKSDVKLHKDNFGYASTHKYLTAHFEHTIAITERGSEILTIIT